MLVSMASAGTMFAGDEEATALVPADVQVQDQQGAAAEELTLEGSNGISSDERSESTEVKSDSGVQVSEQKKGATEEGRESEKLTSDEKGESSNEMDSATSGQKFWLNAYESGKTFVCKHQNYFKVIGITATAAAVTAGVVKLYNKKYKKNVDARKAAVVAALTAAAGSATYYFWYAVEASAAA